MTVCSASADRPYRRNDKTSSTRACHRRRRRHASDADQIRWPSSSTPKWFRYQAAPCVRPWRVEDERAIRNRRRSPHHERRMRRAPSSVFDRLTGRGRSLQFLGAAATSEPRAWRRRPGSTSTLISRASSRRRRREVLIRNAPSRVSGSRGWNVVEHEFCIVAVRASRVCHQLRVNGVACGRIDLFGDHAWRAA